MEGVRTDVLEICYETGGPRMGCRYCWSTAGRMPRVAGTR